MATTTSGRIEINGQRGFCDQEITVSRSMPAVLSDRMLYSSWTLFCDKLDEALAPATKARRHSLIYTILLISFVIVMIIIGMVFVSSSSMASYIPYLIAFVATVGGFCIIWCWTARVRNRVEEEMEKVCDGTSAMHPGVSFYMGRQRKSSTDQGSDLRSSALSFIEVCVSNDTATHGYIAPLAHAASPANIVDEPEIDKGAGNEEEGTAERMGELDQTKQGLLTEDEYQQKRADLSTNV